MAHDQDGPAGRSEEWSDLLESCDDLVQSVTPEGRFLYVNRGWLETLGYTRDEVAGLTVFEVIHPDCRAHCEAVMGRVMAGEAISSVEATFVSKTGEPIRVEGSINCRFRDGKPAGTRGIFRDISMRKAAEEALRESELRLRTIMAAVQDAIVVIDAETHVVVEANETALLMYRGAREEILGRSCYGTICPRQEGECPITDRNLSLDRSEASLRTSTGEVVPVIKTARTVTLGGREHLVESFVNISERKQMEEQLWFLGGTTRSPGCSTGGSSSSECVRSPAPAWSAWRSSSATSTASSSSTTRSVTKSAIACSSRRRAFCRVACARATSWPASAAMSSRSSCPGPARRWRSASARE